MILEHHGPTLPRRRPELPDPDTTRSVHCPGCEFELERSDRSIARWAANAAQGRGWLCHGCGWLVVLEVRQGERGAELAAVLAWGDEPAEELVRAAAKRTRAAVKVTRARPRPRERPARPGA